jgi:DNA polymerase-1
MNLRHSDDPEIKSAVNKVRNKYGKSANFLIAYLGGPSTLAENLLIPLDEAKEIMGSVFSLYQRMQPWQQETIEFAKRYGYTLTAYGSRRHAPRDLWASDKGLASRAGRQVVNATVQGTAADILKVVLTDMQRREMRQRYRLKALKPVYDEISASVPVELAVDYAQELIEVMSVTPPGYPVGMKVDLSIGKTWGSVIEVDDQSKQGIEQALEQVLKQ